MNRLLAALAVWCVLFPGSTGAQTSTVSFSSSPGEGSGTISSSSDPLTSLTCVHVASSSWGPVFSLIEWFDDDKLVISRYKSGWKIVSNSLSIRTNTPGWFRCQVHSDAGTGTVQQYLEKWRHRTTYQYVTGSGGAYRNYGSCSLSCARSSIADGPPPSGYVFLTEQGVAYRWQGFNVECHYASRTRYRDLPSPDCYMLAVPPPP